MTSYFPAMITENARLVLALAVSVRQRRVRLVTLPHTLAYFGKVGCIPTVGLKSTPNGAAFEMVPKTTPESGSLVVAGWTGCWKYVLTFPETLVLYSNLKSEL